MNQQNIISIINYKGGVGRSTITLNLAKILSTVSSKVLCIDLDPKADLTNSSISNHEVFENLYDSFYNTQISLESIIKKTEHGFYLAPSGKNMDNLEYSLQNANFFIPHKRLLSLIKEANFLQFDFILIDTPPFPSIVNINAITAANTLLIPITLDYNCLNALELLFHTLKNMNLEKTKEILFLINKYDNRESNNEEILKHFKEKYFMHFFLKTKIRTDCKFKILINKQKTIFDIEPPRGKGFLDYTMLCNEFLDYLKQTKDVNSIENKSSNI